MWQVELQTTLRYNLQMFSSIFHTLVYDPLYNGFIALVDIIPTADVGIAIVILTVFVKIILFPLSKKAVRTQMVMKELEPELKKIKEKYKKNKQEQARKVMDLYKEKNINPLSGILIVFIQLPVVFALYWIFVRGGLPGINLELLYSFVPQPESANMIFLGTIDMTGKSFVLALFAGITQYFHMNITMPKLTKRKENATLQEDFARSFQMQMKYIFPFLMFGIAYYISAAVALYLLTSNIFAIWQEHTIRSKYKK